MNELPGLNAAQKEKRRIAEGVAFYAAAFKQVYKIIAQAKASDKLKKASKRKVAAPRAHG
jgi:hypothetical protein